MLYLYTSSCTEHLVESGSECLESSHVVSASLEDKSHSSPHSKASILKLLVLHLLHVSIRLREIRSKSKETGFALSRFTSSGSRNSRYGLSNHNKNQRSSDVLWVRVPDLPEGVHLILCGGSLTSRGRSEGLNPNSSGNSQHGNTSVLDLSLAKPVKIDSDIINVGETKGVKSLVSGHGRVKKSRLVHERKRWAPLGVQGGRLDRVGGRCEGTGRSGGK
mmetsp:Transcript_17853/g.38538  ORF Transcript_17853/g.38538 Transcript_17853/m.38538 type:complete len:219 (-) Transcript_17853:126-782(-)